MLEKWILEKLKEIGLEDSKEVLCKFRNHLELHSIFLAGGGARCYYDQNDDIRNHKDLDIHIFFSPKESYSKNIGKLAKKIGGYKRPKVYKSRGFPTKEDRVDVMRNVLHHSSSDIISDILKYACPRKKWKKWKNFLDSPKVLLYPEIKPICFKLMNKC